MPTRFLTALPVYNEQQHVEQVLDSVAGFAQDVVVVDDGSVDATADLLASRDDVQVIRHSQNRGYGAALQSAFQFGIDGGYDVVVTIDCDGQHEPQRIPDFVAACRDESTSGPVDIVSGSRYLKSFDGDGVPPEERRNINLQLTAEINRRLGLQLTDAFCGFKAYRTACLSQLHTVEIGYAMPLELWVRAASAQLRIIELPVPLIYLEEKRSFGGELDDGETRLKYYYQVLDQSLNSIAAESGGNQQAVCGECAG